MTPEEINRLEGLYSRTIQGRWEHNGSWVRAVEYDQERRPAVWDTVYKRDPFGFLCYEPEKEANGDFIAEIHNAFPAILAELRKKI